MGVEHKILSITTDNASNNLTMMKDLQEKFRTKGVKLDHIKNHIRCMAHSINLAVQLMIKPFQTKRVKKKLVNQDEDHISSEEEDDHHLSNLKATECRIPDNFNAVLKIRSVAKYIRNSPQRIANFKDIAIKKSHGDILHTLDVPTRWNSTYTMLERALVLRQATNEYMGIYHLYLTYDIKILLK